MSKLYLQSVGYAKKHGEMEQWKESMRENIACKEAVEKAIRENFDGMYLNRNAAEDVISHFGKERVSFVLAITIYKKMWDGRFSEINKEWSKGILPEERSEELFDQFTIFSHPAILNGFVNLVRQVPEERSIGETFEIYQLKNRDCGYTFMGTEFVKKMGLVIDRADYEKVYEDQMQDDDDLESIYERFNIDRPKDFTGHSLSVSDVVVTVKGDERRAFYVDTFGFSELSDFEKKKEKEVSILKHLEDDRRNQRDRIKRSTLRQADRVVCDL